MRTFLVCILKYQYFMNYRFQYYQLIITICNIDLSFIIYYFYYIIILCLGTNRDKIMEKWRPKKILRHHEFSPIFLEIVL